MSIGLPMDFAAFLAAETTIKTAEPLLVTLSTASPFIALELVGGLIALIYHYIHSNNLDHSVVMLRFDPSSQANCTSRFGIDKFGKSKWKHGDCIKLDKGAHMQPWLGRQHAFSFGKELYDMNKGHDHFCEILGFSGHHCTGDVVGAWDNNDVHMCLHTEQTLKSVSMRCRDGHRFHRWHKHRGDLYSQYRGSYTTSVSENASATGPDEQVYSP